MMLLLWTLLACQTEGPQVTEPRTTGELVFRDPETCRDCHPDHVADWEGSMHAYAMTDPVFHALADVQAMDFTGKGGQFCTQCHSVPGFLSGETPVAFSEELQRWDQRTEGLSAVAQKGVSCDVCHSITEILEQRNARIALTPDGTVRGPIADPVETEAHASTHSPLHTTGEFCIGCHNVGIPFAESPLLVEKTGVEWLEYKALGGDKECQDCHMPARLGQAAVDGPERTIHAHTFVGVDTSLVDGFPDMERQEALVDAMLQSAVLMQVTADATSTTVQLTNQAGHSVPSGSTAERRMWVDVRLVRDRDQALIYSSGQLDKDGVLRDGTPDAAADFCTGGATTLDPLGDPDLWWFGAHIIGMCDEYTLFAHLANDDPEEHLLRPLATESRTYTFPSLDAEAHTLTVKLQFRAFLPQTVRAVQAHPQLSLPEGLLDKVKVRTMAESTTAITP
ncbi:MAG: hypothetical protein KC912_18315 [Proteobacteria bacterium]|nr:hypothetical protein [Pseudomonadota bacterium]